MPREIKPPASPNDGTPQANLSWPQQRVLTASLLIVWLALIAYGYFSLRHKGVMVDGEELAPTRCVFLVMNGATLTGFQQAIGISEFNPENSHGATTVLTLILFGSFFTMVVGGLAVVRILRLNYSAWQVIGSALLFQFLASIAGAAAIIGHGRTLFDSVFQSAAAFGNCGLAMGPISSVDDRATYVLLVLATLGGLGLPVLMELYDAMWGLGTVSTHTRCVVRLAAGVYLLAFFTLLLFQWPQDDANTWATWKQAIGASSVEALNTRTAGMHFEMIGVLPRAAQWVLIVLMAVGASSAGTGGGIKSTTFAQLWRGARSALSGKPVMREFGIAFVWFAIYVALALAGLLVLLTLNSEIAADQMLFIVISALSNVGLSHNPIAIVGAGLNVLSVLMLLGRLAPLCILWWMAETTSGAELAVG
jgi:Trk-type K+ transport system membrane component